MQHIINYNDNQLEDRKVLCIVSCDYISGRPAYVKIAVSYALNLVTHRTPIVRLESIVIEPDDPAYGIAINLTHLNDSFSKLFKQ